MKIGYLLQAGAPDILNNPISGPANHVKHTVRELQNLGHQVRVIYVSNGKIYKSDDLEQFTPVIVRSMDQGLLRVFERGVRRVQSKLHLPYMALFDSFRFGLACWIELKGFDVLYERMGWMGYGGGLASRWLGIPLVIEVNGDHLSELDMLGIRPEGLQRKLSSEIMKRAVRRAAHVIASGNGWRESFIKRWNYPPEKISVVENGSEILEMLDRPELRAFQDTRSTSNYVNLVYLGAFEPWHGISILLQALACAVQSCKSLQLTLIGSGSLDNQLREEVSRLELENYVSFTGRLNADQFASHLANADIGISAYCGRVEYSGLKLIDYKAAGLAIIASGKDGQPEVITHMQTGWIVPPCDAEALCGAILHLANNDDQRKKLGQHARLDAEKHHSWRSATQQISQKIQSTLT